MFDDVKALILKHNLTNLWMIRCLNEKGIIVDTWSFSKWLNGKQLGDKAKEVHDICIKLLTAYEERFANVLKEI